MFFDQLFRIRLPYVLLCGVCVYVCVYVYVWVCAGMYGYVWVSVGTCGYVWVSICVYNKNEKTNIYIYIYIICIYNGGPGARALRVT